MAGDFGQELPREASRVSARTLASFVQALLHGSPFSAGRPRQL